MSNQPRYVRIKKFSDLTGYTEAATRNKIAVGVWCEGVHFRRAPDHSLLMDLEAFEKWVEGEQLTQALNRVMAQSASPSPGRAKGGAKRSASNPRKATSGTLPD